MGIQTGIFEAIVYFNGVPYGSLLLQILVSITDTDLGHGAMVIYDFNWIIFWLLLNYSDRFATAVCSAM